MASLFDDTFGGLFGTGPTQQMSGTTAAPSPHHGFNWGQAALGMLGVPAAALRKIRTAREESDDADKKELAQQQLNTMINGDPMLTTPQARAYAMANPKAYIDAYFERTIKPWATGPEGGSRGLPGADGTISNWQTAPRFTNEGTIYAPGNGTAVPQILQRGAKMEPIQAGGHLDTVDPLTGRPITQDGGVLGLPETHPSAGPQSTALMSPPPTTFTPGQTVNGYRFNGGDDTNQANWEYVGGAARSGPPTFP